MDRIDMNNKMHKVINIVFSIRLDDAIVKLRERNRKDPFILWLYLFYKITQSYHSMEG